MGDVRSPDRRPALAFVFPGQGGQWDRMGRDLLRDEPVFAAAIAACDEAMRRWVDWSVRDELLRPEATSRLDNIEFIQPATFAIQVALAALWASWGIVPDAVVGQSMGEIAAARVAGALSLDDASRVICHQGRLLGRLSGKGAMAVVELSRSEAEAAIAGRTDVLSLAGSNGPSSSVLSGEPVALNRVLERLDDEGVFHRLLRVDVAPHGPQMDSVRDELLALLDGLAPRAADTPIYSTVTAQPCSGETLDANYWARNLREPFRFAETIALMAAHDHTVFVEISPHPILSGAILEAQQAGAGHLVVLPSLERDMDAREVLLGSLAELDKRGFPVTWPQVRPTDVIAAHLRSMIADVLRRPADELSIDSRLSSEGLDSIRAAAVRTRIQLGFGVRVPMLALLRGTIAGLAVRVLQATDVPAPPDSDA